MLAIFSIFVGIFHLFLLGLTLNRVTDRRFKFLYSLFLSAAAIWCLSVGLFFFGNPSIINYFDVKLIYVSAILISITTLYLSDNNIYTGNLVPKEPNFAYHKNKLFAFVKFFLTALTFIVSLAIFIDNDFIIKEFYSKYRVSINAPNYYLYVFALVAPILIGLLILLRNLKFSDISRRRGPLAHFVVITSCYLVALVFNVAIPYFGTYSLISIGTIASALLPIATLFMRGRNNSDYQLFDIKTSAFRAVGYTFTLLAVAFMVILISFRVAFPVLGLNQGVPSIVYLVAFFGIVFVSWAVPRFRKFFDRVTYKLFYRNSYNPAVFAEQISAVVTSNPKTTDLQKGLLKLYHRAFSSQYIQIVVNHAEDEASNQKQFEIGQTMGAGAPAEPLNFYERLFVGHEHKNKYVLRSKIDFEEGSDEAKFLDKHSIGMIAKLKLNRRVIGYLVFGEKTSGTLYTLEDIDLITSHYSEVAVALQNSTRYNRIAKFNLELQEKVDIATAKLKKSNARLRKLDKAKDDFLSIASHQLRTPLTVVRGNIDLVANGDMGPVTEDARGVLVQSERSAGRLSDLINDFLSTSRLKTGKFILDPKETNLKYTVEQQIEQLVDFAAQRGIKLTLHKVDNNLPIVVADEEKLRQVMLNTIDNAIYYSPRHKGKVDVMLYSDGKNIIYKVKDNGIGVPAHEKAKLFGRMYRADNAKNARPDGNGLGLFLMKKIIDAHHGEIIFETKEGEGSTFGFKLAIKPQVQLTRQVIS
jgi:signal transduction histidine kinase